MRLKTGSAILVAALCAFIAVACAKPAEEKPAAVSKASAPTTTAPVRIGFSMDTLREERWLLDKELVEQRANQVGATIDVQVANGDDALQARQCNDMLARGIDVLIIAPHNSEAAAAIVGAAHDKGVPVISYDRLIRNAGADLYVTHVVDKIGMMQAQYALKHAPKGNYVLIGGAPTDNNSKLLQDGQLKVLQPAIDRGDINIVSRQFAREWLPSEATRITEAALAKSGGNIQAIIASNDGTAGGAIEALRKAGLAGKVLVTGQDAEQPAVRRILAGSQAMTIYKPIQPLAFSAVDSALRLARKEPLQTTGTISDGKKNVPVILQEPMVVDKTNVSRLPHPRKPA